MNSEFGVLPILEIKNIGKIEQMSLKKKRQIKQENCENCALTPKEEKVSRRRRRINHKPCQMLLPEEKSEG